MRRVDIGGGQIALEVDGPADQVAGLAEKTLIDNGWSAEAIKNSNKYNSGTDALGHSRPWVRPE